VGATDNFFEIGGRSLLAARIFAQIEKTFGRSLPIATLFTHPTVEQLARVVDAVDGEEDSSLVVRPLQREGKRTPFFCIPGAGSDAIVFQDLSRALGPEQPFYGLQAAGLDAVAIKGEYPTVEEVSEKFIRAIRRVQPEGPYNLGGHCFGCLLAWEVASRLQRDGHQVGLLALLDPIVSNVFSGEIMGRDRLRYHSRKFLGMSFSSKCAYFLEKVRNFSRTLVVRRRIAQSYEQARTMHSRYRLSAQPLRALVFLANDSFFRLAPDRDPRRYYERLAEGGVEYVEVDGDHHGILHEPGVSGLAVGLGSRMEGARSIAPRSNP
jgi:thioesterase domain-containing protein